MRIDFLTIFGMLLAGSAIGYGQISEGGSLANLVNGSAFLIVIGGTLGAVTLQTPSKIFYRAIEIFPWIFSPPKVHIKEGMQRLVEISVATRKEGILSIESQIDNEKDYFLKKGLELIIDGNTAIEVRNSLIVELESEEQRDLDATKVYESLGGYSPTIGILGTVIGLIQVMEHLSDPTELGAGIAVAFIATIYGVGFANLIFLPVSHKLRTHVLRRTRGREMFIEGFASIAEGEHPRMIETRLKGFLED
jgi:chemotaxis protein MotA